MSRGRHLHVNSRIQNRPSLLPRCERTYPVRVHRSRRLLTSIRHLAVLPNVHPSTRYVARPLGAMIIREKKFAPFSMTFITCPRVSAFAGGGAEWLGGESANAGTPTASMATAAAIGTRTRLTAGAPCVAVSAHRTGNRSHVQNGPG